MLFQKQRGATPAFLLGIGDDMDRAVWPLHLDDPLQETELLQPAVERIPADAAGTLLEEHPDFRVDAA